ncbi:MAG: hypothetical protein BMS9Abin26_1675 [Gammaproteobacteria bacterium]|nr:MAG: hypothetical protein BMS9Abin26_1675 [Gammaproteobacteria bacterium]
MNESELYGCVVAKSYELESSIAKSPRVVLGKEVIQYLEANSQVSGDGVNDEYGRQMASVCKDMITQDEDGQYIVDYLGSGFRRHIANNIGNSIYNDALTYIEEQIEHWTSNENEELMERYHFLNRYFEKNKSLWQE